MYIRILLVYTCIFYITFYLFFLIGITHCFRLNTVIFPIYSKIDPSVPKNTISQLGNTCVDISPLVARLIFQVKYTNILVEDMNNTPIISTLAAQSRSL